MRNGLKIFKGITGILLLLVSLESAFASDMDVLYNRYMQMSLTNPSQASVQNALALLNSDGSFSDLDYTSTGDLNAHLSRLKIFGGAYQSVGNAYYHDTNIKKQYYTCIQYWITKDHRPANWWYRHIAYPKASGPCLFLMNTRFLHKHFNLYRLAVILLFEFFFCHNKFDFTISI